MEKFTNEQALEVIKVMIEKTKEKQCYNGFYHLLWGILVSLAIVVMHILIKTQLYYLIGYSWALFGFGGAIASIIYSKKTFKKQGNIKYPDLGISSMWIGLMIALFFVTFVFPILKAYEWKIIYAMVSLLMGSANFSTGIFLKQKMSIINAILWWIGCIILIILQSYFAIMGVFVILLIVNNIIPGIYFYNLARKDNGK